MARLGHAVSLKHRHAVDTLGPVKERGRQRRAAGPDEAKRRRGPGLVGGVILLLLGPVTLVAGLMLPGEGGSGRWID